MRMPEKNGEEDNLDGGTCCLVRVSWSPNPWIASLSPSQDLFFRVSREAVLVCKRDRPAKAVELARREQDEINAVLQASWTVDDFSVGERFEC
jgi:hypothetical protein